jgi:hypothetical protein
MADPVEPLEHLGREVANTLDRARAERQHAIDRARRGFLEEAPRSGVGWRWGLPAAAALGVVAALAVLFALRGSGRLTFRVNGADGRVDAWVAAGEKPVALAFSDGTEVRLERAARARVVGVTSEGARIALESGELRANVVHTGKSAWFLVAGPITVHVTGTSFDMRWDPARERFAIAVSEGSVRVSASNAGTEHAVKAGERLFVSLPDNRYELNGAKEEPLAAPGPSAVVAERVEPPAKVSSAPSSSVTPQSTPPAALDWRALLERGELRAAFASADNAGFQQVCEVASAAQLLALGDAARVSNRTDRVSEALLSLRRRFPRDTRSAAAAFALGKVAFDQKRSYSEAANWFATSIREQPNGSLAREAAGRYMEARRASGDRSAAEKAAREYLSRYPDGPHAKLARSLLP